MPIGRQPKMRRASTKNACRPGLLRGRASTKNAWITPYPTGPLGVASTKNAWTTCRPAPRPPGVPWGLPDWPAMSTLGRPPRNDLAFLGKAMSLVDDEHELGFTARVFAQTSLPYKDPGPDCREWVRRNGALTLSVQAGPSVPDKTGQLVPTGYPYGSVPRLLLTWMATEAVRRQERTLHLGESLADFMRQLGMAGPTGGSNGSITRLRDQARRLFMSRMTAHYAENASAYQRESFQQLTVADEYDLYWSNQPEQLLLIPSFVTLSERFYNEVMARPVPVSMDALRLLKGSAMRLDLYTWLTYRMSYLRKRSTISWEQLLLQFGSSAETRGARHKFMKDFTAHLARVLVVYPEAKVDVTDTGLVLYPSPPHVARRAKPGLHGD